MRIRPGKILLQFYAKKLKRVQRHQYHQQSGSICNVI